MPPNSALQRSGTHELLGRGRPSLLRGLLPRARVLIRWRAAAELGSQATRRPPRTLKKIGPTTIAERHKATCHCGAVELELHLPDGVVDPRHCDCSICRRKGAVVASIALSGLKIVKGHDVLKVYQFNTQTAKHFFCSVCGIYTHHQRRSH